MAKTSKKTSSPKKKAPAKKAAKTSAKKSPKTEKKPTAEEKAIAERQQVLWYVRAGVVVAILVLVALVVMALNLRQAPAKDPVIVSVNGEPIYLSEVQVAYERLPEQLRAAYTPEVILNQTIDKVLILQDARKNGITVTQEEVNARVDEQAATLGTSTQEIKKTLEENGIAWSEYEDAVREELILTRYVDDIIIPSIDISDTKILAYYEGHEDTFSAKEGQMRIRHILLETEEDAWAVFDKAEAGEDFALLAEANSIGPTAATGGDLGFISAESPLVEEFKAVALELDVGEVSVPVQTEFGWHVIKREQDTIPLREARDTIVDSLTEEEGRALFQLTLAKLREEAEIKELNSLEGISTAPAAAS